MPKRVPMVSVIVIRDGKRVSPPVGKGFNFTEDEIKQITDIQAGALRKPVNESVEVEDEGHESDDSAAATAPSKAAPDGSKKATANKGTKAAGKTKAKDKDVKDTAKDNEQQESGDDDDEDADTDADEDGEDEDI